RQATAGGASTNGHDVLRNRPMGPFYSDLKHRIDREPLLLHWAHDGVQAPVGGPGSPVLAYQRRNDVEEPQATALPNPGGRIHRKAFVAEPLDEALPVGNLHVYQRPLIHERTPCFLLVMALNKAWACRLVFRS